MYQIWHKNNLVIEVSEDGQVDVIDSRFLPFDLRHRDKVTYVDFLNYMSRRISTLQRTYMNQLYKQRRIGRGHVEIINDSAAISPVDLFWITRPALGHTWESLQIKRDESWATARASLEGVIDPGVMFGEKDDHTSIFSVKGAFPKAILKGHILKKGSNAEYEVVASAMGEHLGIKTAKARAGKDGVVECELFTSERTSLVHALELLYPFNAETYADVYERAEEFCGQREDLGKDLQRLYIFNYLCSNNDLHVENFGFMYDTSSFEVVSVAPAFDFNAGFEAWGSLEAYNQYIFKNLRNYMNNNQDLINPLEGIKKLLGHRSIKSWLKEEQVNEIESRAKYLVGLVEMTKIYQH